MPSAITLQGITGLDNVVPVYAPNDRWTIWALKEIYTGQQGLNRYVPKVDDYVVDTETNQYYRVAGIDPTTAIAEMVPIYTIDEAEFSPSEILFGVGPGTQADTYRAYLDTSVIPHTLAVDARLSISGTMATKAKIFRGTNLQGTSEVISAFYDGVGNILGQDITLELASMPNSQNFTTKTVPVCYTTHELPDNEVLTIVFYSDTGHVVSKRQLLVENTSFIRSIELGTKYVTGISLETPFLSTSDPTLIQYPLNVPINGMNMVGVVEYSDGTTLRLPVDNTKFSIWGFETFVSTIVGQKFPLVLKYNLSPGEAVYGSTNTGAGQFISESYKAITLNADGAYTTRLYCYPVWIDAINGYRLEWFMYSLERSLGLKVTPYVRLNPNSPAFNPLQYGYKQSLSVSVNLRDINGSYRPYIHTQVIDVVLLAPGTDRTTNWSIGFAPNQNPLFGINNFAVSNFINQNLWKLKVDSGYATLESWLENLYYKTLPLTDGASEVQAPVPDYFKIVVGNNEVEYPITQWSTQFTYNGTITNNSTIYIKFLKRTADNDIQLSIAGLPVYQGGDIPGGVIPPSIVPVNTPVINTPVTDAELVLSELSIVSSNFSKHVSNVATHASSTWEVYKSVSLDPWLGPDLDPAGGVLVQSSINSNIALTTLLLDVNYAGFSVRSAVYVRVKHTDTDSNVSAWSPLHKFFFTKEVASPPAPVPRFAVPSITFQLNGSSEEITETSRIGSMSDYSGDVLHYVSDYSTVIDDPDFTIVHGESGYHWEMYVADETVVDWLGPDLEPNRAGIFFEGYSSAEYAQEQSLITTYPGVDTRKAIYTRVRFTGEISNATTGENDPVLGPWSPFRLGFHTQAPVTISVAQPTVTSPSVDQSIVSDKSFAIQTSAFIGTSHNQTEYEIYTSAVNNWAGPDTDAINGVAVAADYVLTGDLTSFVANLLQPERYNNRTMYVRVRHYDGPNAVSPWSPLVKFVYTYVKPIYLRPTILSPLDGATFSDSGTYANSVVVTNTESSLVGYVGDAANRLGTTVEYQWETFIRLANDTRPFGPLPNTVINNEVANLNYSTETYNDNLVPNAVIDYSGISDTIAIYKRVRIVGTKDQYNRQTLVTAPEISEWSPLVRFTYQKTSEPIDVWKPVISLPVTDTDVDFSTINIVGNAFAMISAAIDTHESTDVEFYLDGPSNWTGPDTAPSVVVPFRYYHHDAVGSKEDFTVNAQAIGVYAMSNVQIRIRYNSAGGKSSYWSDPVRINTVFGQ